MWKWVCVKIRNGFSCYTHFWKEFVNEWIEKKISKIKVKKESKKLNCTQIAERINYIPLKPAAINFGGG